MYKMLLSAFITCSFLNVNLHPAFLRQLSRSPKSVAILAGATVVSSLSKSSGSSQETTPPKQQSPSSRYGTHAICTSVTNLVSGPGASYVGQHVPGGSSKFPKMLGQLRYGSPVIPGKKDPSGEWTYVESLLSLIYSPQGEPTRLGGWVESRHIHGPGKWPEMAPDTESERKSEGSHNRLICSALWTPAYQLVSQDPDRFEPVATFTYSTYLRSTGYKKDEWYEVELIDGTRAFVPAPCVRISFPTNQGALRDQIVADAHKFLGAPYLWGGRSGPGGGLELTSQQLPPLGTDCSGLIWLLYLTAGIVVAHNSRSQFYSATPIFKFTDLKKADAIFLATRATPEADPVVCHVMLYVGDGCVIESWAARASNGSSNMQPAHKISLKDKLGEPLEELYSGKEVGRFTVYAGSFIPQHIVQLTQEDSTKRIEA
jgi:hypothetical protein